MKEITYEEGVFCGGNGFSVTVWPQAAITLCHPNGLKFLVQTSDDGSINIGNPRNGCGRQLEDGWFIRFMDEGMEKVVTAEYKKGFYFLRVYPADAPIVRM